MKVVRFDEVGHSKITYWAKMFLFFSGRLVLSFHEFWELGARKHAVGTGAISTFQRCDRNYTQWRLKYFAPTGCFDYFWHFPRILDFASTKSNRKVLQAQSTLILTVFNFQHGFEKLRSRPFQRRASGLLTLKTLEMPEPNVQRKKKTF